MIMPVAGGTGLGTAAAAQAADGELLGDLGRRRRLRERAAVLLGLPHHRGQEHPGRGEGRGGQGVDQRQACVTGGIIGTLANNGVSIAPYHEFDSKVDAGLKAEVEKLKADIIAGTIKVDVAGSAQVTPFARVSPDALAVDVPTSDTGPAPVVRSSPWGPAACSTRLLSASGQGGCAETRTARHHQALR